VWGRGGGHIHSRFPCGSWDTVLNLLNVSFFPVPGLFCLVSMGSRRNLSSAPLHTGRASLDDDAAIASGDLFSYYNEHNSEKFEKSSSWVFIRKIGSLCANLYFQILTLYIYD